MAEAHRSCATGLGLTCRRRIRHGREYQIMGGDDEFSYAGVEFGNDIRLRTLAIFQASWVFARSMLPFEGMHPYRMEFAF